MMKDLLMALAAGLGGYYIGKGKESEASGSTIPGEIGGPGPTFAGPISGVDSLSAGYIQQLLYANGIFVLSTAPGGTTTPAGSREYPCKTLAEARTVAAARGSNIIVLLDAHTLDADMLGYIFMGGELSSPGLGSLDINGFSVDGSMFYKCSFTGVAHAATADTIAGFDSVCGITANIVVYDLHECSIVEGVTLYPHDGSSFHGCYCSKVIGITIDLSAHVAGFSIIVDDWRGGAVTFTNLTVIADVGMCGRGFATVAASNTAGVFTFDDDVRVSNLTGGATVNDYTSYYVLTVLAARLSAARAVNLDELAAANIPADIDELKASKGRARHSLRPVASACIEEVQLTNVAGDKALGSIVVNTIPASAVVTNVLAAFTFRAIENTSANANKLNGAQEIQIQKGAGAWNDAINFVDDQFGLGGNMREGGCPVFGTINLSGVVTGNDTYNFQWDEAVADAANLQFNDCQVLLYIEYSI